MLLYAHRQIRVEWLVRFVVFTADLIHLVMRTDVSEVSDFLMNIVNDADIAGYGERPYAELPSFECMIAQKGMKAV